MANVIVLPTVKTRGWNGDPGEQLRVHSPVDLRQALGKGYRSDACLVQYTSADGSPLPRLNLASLGYFMGKPAEEQPRLEVVLVDIDHGGHTPPPADGSWEREVLARVPEELSAYMGWYRTPNGLRLVFEPTEPVRLPKVEAYLAAFDAKLRAARVPIDEGTRDWTRLYKAPRALKRKLPCDYSKLAPLPAGTFPDPEQLPDELPRLMGALANGPAPAVQELTDIILDRVKSSKTRRQLKKGTWTVPPGGRHAGILALACELIENGLTCDEAYQAIVPSLPAMNGTGERHVTNDELYRVCTWAAARFEGERLEEVRHKTSLYEDIADLFKCTVGQAHSRLGFVVGQNYFMYDPAWRTYRSCSKQQLDVWLAQEFPALTMRDLLGQMSIATSLRYRYALPGERVYHFDEASSTLTIPTGAAAAGLAPRFHPEIDRWLRALPVKEENVDRLLDWLAGLSQTDRPTCALYLYGPGGAGKSLLAIGLAALFGANNPVDYEEIAGTFQGSVLDCPLIWADESIRNVEDMAGTLRRLTGNTAMAVNRKYQSVATLTGCTRLLITANNDKLLDFGDLSEDDASAITQRLGYVNLSSKAGQVLAENQADLDEWKERKIAEHALWLSENRDLSGRGRFLVTGWATKQTENLHLQGGLKHAIVEAVASAIVDKTTGTAIEVFDGKVYVNSRALAQEWELLLGHRNYRAPTGRGASNVLEELSGDTRARLRRGRKTRRYWVLDANWLARSASALNLVDADAIEHLANTNKPDDISFA